MAKQKLAQAWGFSLSRLPEWLPVSAGLATLAIAVYANSLANGFVSDDKIQLLRNPLVGSVSQIPRILESGVWSTWDAGHPGNYYRPLQFLVYLAVHEIAGFSAPAFHSLMILLHAINTVMLYGLVRRMAAGRLAFAAAALFAVHPIHTEVVDWIASVPDLLVTALALGGVWWFARQDGAARGLTIAGHCGVYVAALLTKETGVMLPSLYVGFGFLVCGRSWREMRHNGRLYAALAATLCIYLVLRVAALGSLVPGQDQFFHLNPLEFLLSAAVLAAQYLGALLLPVNLNYFHIFHPTGSFTPAVLIAVLALAVAGAVFSRVRVPLAGFGLFWIAATLAPVLNLTGVGQNVFAERYLYLPSAGFCWIAAWAWDRLAGYQRQWATTGGAAVLLLCAFGTVARNRDWRDDYTLFQVTLRQSPESGWLHNWMASAHVERNEFRQALAEERLAVRYEPGTPAFHENLGNILLLTDARAAVEEFRKFLALQPDHAQGHSDLAMGLEAAGEFREAEAEFQSALRLQPSNQEAQQGIRRVVVRLSHSRRP